MTNIIQQIEAEQVAALAAKRELPAVVSAPVDASQRGTTCESTGEFATARVAAGTPSEAMSAGSVLRSMRAIFAARAARVGDV